MQPVPNKPMVPPFQAPPPGARSGNRACSCFAIGCGGSILLLIALCAMGYYTVFHSSLLLNWVEQAMEESGDVEVEGLEGTIANGFEVKSFRFKNDALVERATGKPRWSELKDIKIKYRGGGFFSSSFTVEEVSVGGGTIYADIDIDSENGGDFVFSELQEEFSDIRSEFGSGSSQGTFEVRLIHVSDLTIADTNSDTRFKIDEIRLDDVVIEDGRLVEFGDLVAKADNIEVETVASEGIPEATLERTLSGRLSQGLVASVLTDIPFEIQFGVMPDGKLLSRTTLFEGKIQYQSGHGPTPAHYVIRGFTPGDHLRADDAAVPIRDIHLDVQYDLENRLKIAQLDSSGSFSLGPSRFSNFSLPEKVDGKTDLRVFQASADVNGRTVDAYVYILPRLPLIGVRLREAGDWSLTDTWAWTAFGRPYAELNSSEQEQIDASMQLAKRKFSNLQGNDREPSPPDPEKSSPPVENGSSKDGSSKDGSSEDDSSGDESPEDQRSSDVQSSREDS